ncbi:MAG: PTS glucose transporter subunit IIA [Anaerovibrio sp.]|uniref:PTS sugar transporter subunit IIA n=1 Tax=Anaerovibrio sp. TaxID=1872532 RepID=UPI001B16A9D7|nr:PTS glucose transporter subunit IIA [Anaerovibrio sp.]MBO6245763.1 PTS glucose transporter subunit IIA [Anaerovibrio sp.]
MAQNTRESSIFAPMTGKIVDLIEVPDDTFSKKMMGDGVAIIPKDGMLYSPISGIVSVVAATKHAIGFQTNTGLNILVHVGLEAHEVADKTTILHVKQGQRVQAGDLVAEYDLGAFEEKGINTITPVIVVNEEEDDTEIKANVGDVEAGAGEIFRVVEIIKEEAPEGEEKPAEEATKETGASEKEVKEPPKDVSVIDELKNESEEFLKDSTNWVKLGAMFVGLVAILVVIFVTIGVFLNSGGGE